MPAAIVARSDIKHNVTSFSSKPSKQYKHHDASNFTHPQAISRGNLKSAVAASPSANLPLRNKIAEQSFKTSLPAAMPVEEEVQEPTSENKTAPASEHHDEVPTTVTRTTLALDSDVPLCDDVDDDANVQQFYSAEHFTPIVREAWNYLTGPTPAKSRMEFPGMGPREFDLLEHAVRETGRVASKPRLTYDYNKHLLIIDMPTVLHEAFYDDLKKSFTLAMENLPYNRRAIYPQIHMNYPLQITDKSVTPDMTISLTATQGPMEVELIPFVGETALTEDWDHVFEKVESMIAAHPEAVLASIVLVREVKPYASPADESIASDTLHNRQDSDLCKNPEPFPLKEFINKRSTPRNFGEPVNIADHTWCHVRSVEYFLWLKGEGDEPIDMRNGKAEHRAHGVLVPESYMDGVTEILDRAMTKMRSLFLTFQKGIKHASAIDNSILQNFVIPPFPIDWELVAFRIMSAVDLTAHLRYVNWHAVRFRGMKRERDPSYEPSSESEPDDDNAKRSGASKPPSHHVFQTILIDSVLPVSKSNLAAVASSSKSSSGKPKKNSGTGKSKSSKGDKKSRAGHAGSGKGVNKRRKV